MPLSRAETTTNNAGVLERALRALPQVERVDMEHLPEFLSHSITLSNRSVCINMRVDSILLNNEVATREIIRNFKNEWNNNMEDTLPIGAGDRVEIIAKSIGSTQYTRIGAELTVERIVTREEAIANRSVVPLILNELEENIQIRKIYRINGNYYLRQDLKLIEEPTTQQHDGFETNTIVMDESLNQERRREMDWRSVEGHELIGKRVKCTYQTNGTIECTKTHVFTGFVGETTIIATTIPGTRNPLMQKSVRKGKDADGWIIYESAISHRATRGSVERTWYQAICPEHVEQYEAELAEMFAREATRAAEAVERENERLRRQAEEATALREREERERAERAIRENEERVRREAERVEIERIEAINREKYNIWAYHEKGSVE